MDKDTVIKVENLAKKFSRSLKRSMFYGSIDVARNMIGISYDTGKLRKGEFWSLQGINFELKKGEALGVIGQNGSGKSTLLRLINGIYPPDHGRIMVRGKIGALIAVGAGFHPHMTGRENIYLNGTILGMSREEIDRKFDSIIEFADIGDFIDAPVATYSSGMTVRLGFSIAIHSEPEILLADEVLAVGDLGFALKCYRKIAEYRESGGTILLVSHGMQLIRNTCDRVLWIDKGQMRSYGSTQAVCDEYEKFVLERDASGREKEGAIIKNDPDVDITAVEFLGEQDRHQSSYRFGEQLKVRIKYTARRKVEKPVFTVSFVNPENIQVISNYSNFDGCDIPDLSGQGHIDFIIDRITLKPSEYRCTITFAQHADVSNVLEWHDKSYRFIVEGNDVVSYGIFNPLPKWELKNN